MESLRSKNSSLVFDPIRNRWVKSTPEEKIRQALLSQMINKLGYPLPLIAVEKQLTTLPHLLLTPLHLIPKRRADIIVFAKQIHPDYSMFPLLLIECKAVALTKNVVQQVISYNDSIKAPFIAVANETQVVTGLYCTESKQFRFENGLSPYSDLIHLLSSLQKSS